jgi:hypothetical protein
MVFDMSNLLFELIYLSDPRTGISAQCLQIDHHACGRLIFRLPDLNFQSGLKIEISPADVSKCGLQWHAGIEVDGKMS